MEENTDLLQKSILWTGLKGVLRDHVGTACITPVWKLFQLIVIIKYFWLKVFTPKHPYMRDWRYFPMTIEFSNRFSNSTSKSTTKKAKVSILLSLLRTSTPTLWRLFSYFYDNVTTTPWIRKPFSDIFIWS